MDKYWLILLQGRKPKIDVLKARMFVLVLGFRQVDC